MAKREKRCDLNNCRGEVLDSNQVAIIAYVSSGLAMAVFLVNSMSAYLKNAGTLASLDFGLTALLCVGAWILSGIVTHAEHHENALSCAVHACGIPGVLIAVLTIAQGAPA